MHILKANDTLITITATATETSTYASATTSYLLKVNSKAVTVKADDKTMVYGALEPELKATVTGLIGNDTVEYTLSRAAGTAVGTYTITPTGNATQGNYTVTYETGAFTITTKSVTPVIIISQTSYTYDGTAKIPDVTVKDGDTEISSGEYTVSYFDNTNAGTATVTITDKDGGNYTVNGSATFMITKAVITPSIIISGWTYGENANTPTIGGNTGNGTETIRYKLKKAND